MNLNTLEVRTAGVKRQISRLRDVLVSWWVLLRALAVSHPRSCLAILMLMTEIVTFAPVWDASKTLFRFYDGPFYMVVAKTFYNLTPEQAASFWMAPNSYYACHLPLYPLLIRAFQLVTQSYEIGTIMATTFSSVAAVVLFYEVLKRFDWVNSAFWTAFLFCILPPRWLIYKAVGATEPLFFCWVFLSFLAWHKRNAWALAVFILCASLTRITGVLMGPIFFFLFLLEKRYLKALVVPLSASGLAIRVVRKTAKLFESLIGTWLVS